MVSAFITGVSGARLSRDEQRFLADAKPCGLILFARNCQDPDQVSALIDQFKNAIGTDDLIISIDQEGGRVQRLRPPYWRALPAARCYGKLYADDARAGEDRVYLAAALMALELRAVGFNCNMVPVLDLPQRDGHQIISDRAFAAEPPPVAALGRAMAQGSMDSGVLPVMKHIPGHGRATADSHLELPVVAATLKALRAHDFVPFQSLSDLPAAMTAHVVYSDIDPEHPASTSKLVHKRIIRREIGFDGLLMSDDLAMQALTGGFAARAGAVLAAGSDLVLHCNGRLDEMMQIATVVPALAGKSLERFNTALSVTKNSQVVDISRCEAAIAEGLAVKH